MERIEEIIEKLEQGNLTVEEGVKLFEEGANLIKLKEADIKTGKGKVTVLKDLLKDKSNK